MFVVLPMVETVLGCWVCDPFVLLVGESVVEIGKHQPEAESNCGYVRTLFATTGR